MDVSKMTPEEIRRHGMAALNDALGPVGMARFLQQFERGDGDYTRDRHQWLPQENVQGLVAMARERRAQKNDHHS
jgi:hypothetical protein